MDTNQLTDEQKACPHNVIRKSKDRHAENIYICGSCSALFAVKEKTVDPEPKEKPPMFDRRPPWGMRSRQA